MPETLTVRERREVGAFDAVELRYFGTVQLVRGDVHGLEIEGDPDVVPKVRAEVRGGVLILEVGEGWLDRLTSGLLLVANRPLRYTVTLPRLSSVAVSGSGDVVGEGWSGDRLRVKVSGQSDVTLGGLEVDALELGVSGRARVRFSGRAGTLEFGISGSADVTAGDLVSREAEVKVAGQATVEVRVEERLAVRIAGFGTVRYHGDPKVKQAISGAGSVEQVSAG